MVQLKSLTLGSPIKLSVKYFLISFFNFSFQVLDDFLNKKDQFFEPL